MIPKGSALTTGQTLRVGECLVSNNGRCFAEVLSDGRLIVLTRDHPLLGSSVVFDFGRFSPPDYRSTNNDYFIAMQADGNLCAYNGGRFVRDSLQVFGGRFLWGTCQLFNYRPANGQYTAVMQDDGNLCVYKHGSPSPLCFTIFEPPIVDVAKARPSGPGLRIINTTPLPLVARSFLSFCELKPFVAVDYPWGPEGLIGIIHRESDALIRELRRDSQDEPDPASLRCRSGSGGNRGGVISEWINDS